MLLCLCQEFNKIKSLVGVTCGPGPSDVSGGHHDDQQSQQDGQEAVSSERSEGYEPAQRQTKLHLTSAYSVSLCTSVDPLKANAGIFGEFVDIYVYIQQFEPILCEFVAEILRH